MHKKQCLHALDEIVCIKVVQINDIRLCMFANTDETGSLTGLIREKKHFSRVHMLFLLRFGPF